MGQNSIIFTDNLEEVLKAVDSAITAGLVEIGAKAQGYAKDLTPVRTGILRDSIGVEIKKDENTGLFYHDYPFSENYISSLEEDKCFIIKDPNSLIVKRGCVCKGLITKPVENLYMICDNEH